MRKIVFILALVLFTGMYSLVNAQDVITKKDGSEIQAKVTEVGVSDVKYKLYNDQGGPIYSLPKADIFMILYENKTKEVFGAEQKPKPPVTTSSTPQTPEVIGYNPVVKNSTAAAVDSKKGYVGAGIGGAFLLEEYSDASTGYQVSVNAGYRLGKHIGIAGAFVMTSFNVDGLDAKASLGLRGGFIGPLISFSSATGKFEYDIRPLVGLVSYKFDVGNLSADEKSVVGFDIGWTFRWNVSNLIALTGNVDYLYHTEFKNSPDLNLSSAAVSVGVQFRF